MLFYVIECSCSLMMSLSVCDCDKNLSINNKGKRKKHKSKRKPKHLRLQVPMGTPGMDSQQLLLQDMDTSNNSQWDMGNLRWDKRQWDNHQ